MAAVYSAEDLQKRLPLFRIWLSERGAQVLEPTNPWELVRFLVGRETAVIYTNKRRQLTFQGPAKEPLQSFLKGGNWRAIPATGGKRGTKPRIAAIRKRDGDLCFFCQELVPPNDESIEHLVAVAHQGPHHISNLFLGHRDCNSKAGTLSAPEKIRMHVEAVLRRRAAAAPTEETSNA